MAFAVTSLDTKGQLADSITVVSNTITPAAGALIAVAWCARWDGTAATFTFTDTWTNSYTPLTLHVAPGNFFYAQVAYTTHAGASTGTVTVTGSAGSGFHCLAVDQITGHDGVVQTAHTPASFDDTPDFAFGSAIASDSMIWCSLTANDNALTPTVSTSGYTELDSVDHANEDAHTDTAYNTNTGLGTTIAWTGGSPDQRQSLHALEIAPGEEAEPGPSAMQVLLPIF